MSQTDGDPSAKPNPLRSLFARLARRRHGRSSAPAILGEDAPVDMVDQAEAFQELKVEDLMTPRADIIAVEIGLTLGDLVKVFVEAEHSRLPVFRETLDDPVGVVHIKDVVRMMAPTEERPAPHWNEPVLYRLRRDVLYVPGSMRAADLMVRMQAARVHMALVIDEFGGTDGLVTLEDLIEAVVGEIEDEHDEHADAALVERAPGLIDANARAALEDLEAMVGQSLAPEDAEESIDTVGGLVSTLAGRLPQRGEVISHPSGLEFEVIEADPRRIRRVRVRQLTPRPPEDGNEA